MINKKYILRKMQFQDLDQVIQVHLRAFPSFFLSFLGRRFLYLLYEFILQDHSGIAIVAELEKEGIIGFVAGTTQPKGFYSRAIKKKALSFAIASITAVLKKPSIILRLLRALKKPSETNENIAECELMSIAVDPAYSGIGFGQMLEQEFCIEVQKKNAKSIYLTTDLENNEKANLFYIKQGYKIAKVIINNGKRKMNLYYKEL